MKIVICGAGMGGLALAHALVGRAEVTILERDATAADTGGYRISLNHDACRALRTLLPAGLLDEVRSLSDTGTAFEQFTIADSRLRPLIVAAEPAGQDRILAQRQVLRVLFARDLRAQVTYGATVSSVSQDAGGAVVTLADGSAVEADVVVAADGADSAVVTSLLGGSPTHDLGLTGIAGWAALKAPAPSYLTRGPALAFGADGTGVFLSLYRPPARSRPDVAALLGLPALVWGTISRADRLHDVRRATSDALTEQAGQLLRGWSPWLSEHVRRSDPGRTAAFRFRAADPTGPVAGWTPGRVTAVGDAVHAMPPTGGRGASTAICDAADLAAALTAHLDGEPLSEVLSRYQRSIVPRARAAVRESLGPVRVINALAFRPVQFLAAPLLRVAGAVGARRYREGA